MLQRPFSPSLSKFLLSAVSFFPPFASFAGSLEREDKRERELVINVGSSNRFTKGRRRSRPDRTEDELVVAARSCLFGLCLHLPERSQYRLKERGEMVHREERRREGKWFIGKKGEERGEMVHREEGRRERGNSLLGRREKREEKVHSFPPFPSFRRFLLSVISFILVKIRRFIRLLNLQNFNFISILLTSGVSVLCFCHKTETRSKVG